MKFDKKVTISEEEMMTAGTIAIAECVHKNPMMLMISDELTTIIAETTRVVFNHPEVIEAAMKENEEEE